MRPIELAELTYIVLDFETTGLEADNGDEIIEIGAVRVQNKQIQEKIFYSLINPEREVPKAATDVHGITNKDLKAAPVIRQVMPEFLDFLGQGIVVAQNAKFDMSFLTKNLARQMISRFENPVLDTMLLSKFIFSYENRHNLDAIIQRLQIVAPSDGRHRSLGDCYLTAQALIEMINILEKRGLSTLKAIRSCLLKVGPIPVATCENLALF